MAKKNRYQKKEKSLKSEIEVLKKTIDGTSRSMYENGMHLYDQPFIPEYLGFELTVVKDANEVVQANVYQKDGFSIAKYIDTDRDEYVIMKPSGGKNELFINSMHEAFTLLNGCGMQLDIKKYVKEGII